MNTLNTTKSIKKLLSVSFFGLVLLGVNLSTTVAQDAPAIIANDWKMFLKKKFADAEKFRQTISIHKKIEDYNKVRADIAKTRNTLKDLSSLKFFDVKDFKSFVQCLGFENNRFNGGGINWSICRDINSFAEEVIRNGESLDKADTYRRFESARMAKKLSMYARMASGELIDKSAIPGLSNSERLNIMKQAIEMWDIAMKMEKQIVLPEIAVAERKHRKELRKLDAQKQNRERIKRMFQRYRPVY